VSGAFGFWTPQSLPEVYDVIIHIETTRATTLLPAEFPTTFSGS
jgi:hypothetical protein